MQREKLYLEMFAISFSPELFFSFCFKKVEKSYGKKRIKFFKLTTHHHNFSKFSKLLQKTTSVEKVMAVAIFHNELKESKFGVPSLFQNRL